jgi:opacity protein-like surface antigen
MEIKYSLLCLSLVAVTTTSFAANNNPYFYTSVGAGIYAGSFNNFYTDQADADPLNLTQPATQHGYIGQIAFGYSRPWLKRYFFGGALAANVENNKASFQSGASMSNFSDSVKVQYNVDVTFLPGINLSETVSSYLKVGLSYAVIQDNLSSPSSSFVTQDYSSRRSALGIAIGLGAETSLTNNISIFTEAMYYDYGTVNFQSFLNYTATYAHSAHVYAYDVILGVSYSFDA